MDDLFEKLENEEGTKGWGARILKYEGKVLWTPPSVLSISTLGMWVSYGVKMQGHAVPVT